MKIQSISFLDVHHVEISRQLTLIEFDLFKKINLGKFSLIFSDEFYNLGWMNKNKETLSPNITSSILFSNSVILFF
jgi:hypothetical protein